MIMSAVAKLVATGTFHKVARRSSALTSGSWGCGSSGSQKKITMSMSPSAILAPICWSPPSGQDAMHLQPEFVLEHGAGGAGGEELMMAQVSRIELGPPQQLDLLVVVPDHRDYIGRGAC